MNSYDYLRFSQPGGVFYAVVMPAIDLIDRLKINRRIDDPFFGIQRDEDKEKVFELQKFVNSEEAIFPTPIIVSAYEDYFQIGGNKVEIKADGMIGHILDGQHRYLGLKSLSLSALRDFQLLVVFVFGVDAYSDAFIFSTVNSNQKPVSKSLMFDLFSLSNKRSPEKSAHEIVRSLNSDVESPFHKKIKILGKKIEETETLSQAAFAQAVVNEINGKKENIFSISYGNDEDFVIRGIIFNAYKGFDLAIIDIEDDDLKSYMNNLFYKTTGFGGVIKAISDYSVNNKIFKTEFFHAVFRHVFNDMRELKINGVGNSAMLEVKRVVLSGLDKV